MADQQLVFTGKNQNYDGNWQNGASTTYYPPGSAASNQRIAAGLTPGSGQDFIPSAAQADALSNPANVRSFSDATNPQKSNLPSTPVTTNTPSSPSNPALPESNPVNSAVVSSLNSGNSYADTLVKQANTPFGGTPALPSTTPSSASPALPSTTTMGSAQNDTSMTDSLNRSIALQQGATKAAQALSGGVTSPGLSGATTTQPTAPTMSSSWRDAGGNLTDPAKTKQPNPMMAMIGMMAKSFGSGSATPKTPLASSMRDVNGNLV